MSRVTLKSEVANSLCQSLSVFRGDTNKVRLLIGISKMGDGLASKAIIVNGGCMAEIGFKTSLPDEEIVIEQGKPYMSFILSASDFCSYLSALNSYGADIDINYDGTTVRLSIGESVNVPLSTVSPENADPLLQQDYNAALIKVEADKTFLPSLAKGGFLCSPGTDARNLSDRVALIFEKGKCYSYSTDIICIAKSWCDVKVASNGPARAVNFLREKGSLLDKEGQKVLMEKMKPLQNDPAGLLALATEEGFSEEDSVSVGLTAAAFSAMQKIFGGFEKLLLIVTPNNLHVQGGNVLATFALAGAVSSIYQKAVSDWEKVSWGAKVVVDRDAFLRSLQLLKLGEKTVPFKMTYDNNGLAVSKGGTVVHSAVTATEGEPASIDVSLSVDKIIMCVSKLCAGNIIIRTMTDERKASLPISISNGDLEEKVSSYAYIVSVKDAEAKGAEEETPSAE